ncbi:sialidase [Sphingopyxis sp. EG6]|nr:sialidase [Sphingopyxis sp. EG6]
MFRHPGEGRDLNLAVLRTGEIPAFAGMTDEQNRFESVLFKRKRSPEPVEGRLSPRSALRQAQGYGEMILLEQDRL